MHRTWEGVSIDLFELYLSPCVTEGWRQKEINLFVSETIESSELLLL